MRKYWRYYFILLAAGIATAAIYFLARPSGNKDELYKEESKTILETIFIRVEKTGSSLTWSLFNEGVTKAHTGADVEEHFRTGYNGRVEQLVSVEIAKEVSVLEIPEILIVLRKAGIKNCNLYYKGERLSLGAVTKKYKIRQSE